MSNYQNAYGQGMPPAPFNAYQQIQQMFPQPQGSVYSINTLTDIGNVPIGSTGLSVAICFNEQIMYIKSFQNGNPVIMAYRVTPYTKEETPPTPQPDPIESRLDRLEQLIKGLIEPEGGKPNVTV